MRVTIRTIENAAVTAMKPSSQPPIGEIAKLWIELRTPERVRNVPKIARQNAPQTSTAFQARSMFFFSCTITECRNAVATSHGIRAAFSTKSGVPAAPADLLVGPLGPEQDRDAQARPREQRPAARGDDPALVEAPRRERGRRERERHAQAHEAEVEQRRMREHVRVLQARVEAGAVDRGGLGREGALDEDEHEREEHADPAEDRGCLREDVGHELPVEADGGRRDDGQDREPEEERALLAPHSALSR